MKKAMLVSLLCGLLFLTSGCLEKNNLDEAKIYTTVYPLEYFTEVLYGTHSTVVSIYPDGTNIDEYTLTEKQKNTYSKGDVFIYNGTTNEKQIAKDFSNINSKLQIIDVAYGLKFKYGMEELWLSPSNALMLARNIKDNLSSSIGSKLISEEIEKNYKNLEETLSLKDAELRNIAKTATEKGKNTLIVSSNLFRFLEDYGFQIISLENQNEDNLNVLKKNFKNGTYKYLFIKNNDNMTGLKDFENQGANLITIHTMTTLSDQNRKNSDTYITIMQEFIENIKNATLS